MEKEEEKSIKEKLKEQYSFKEYHLKKYIETAEIVEENTYYLFNDKADYIRCI